MHGAIAEAGIQYLIQPQAIELLRSLKTIRKNLKDVSAIDLYF